jgi:C-terminal processing protease CtpA/Prc
MAAKLRENAGAGAYRGISNTRELANRLTEDLRAICKDKHLRVSAAALPDEREGGPMRHKGTPDDARRENFGFRKVELLAGNIGYIKFDEFHPSEAAKQVAAGAMGFLANADALIFDLRENGGGSPEMIAFLSSYLFDKPTHLNSFYDRSSNKTEEFWTQETVPGRRFANDLPVYVLVSNYTFSGAEEFAYNLLNLNRATIVGQTTGGGAHPVKMMPINDRFSMMVPYARAVNPISKANWEGVGVKPDIDVPAAEALERAKQEALKKIGDRKIVVTRP